MEGGKVRTFHTAAHFDFWIQHEYIECVEKRAVPKDDSLDQIMGELMFLFGCGGGAVGVGPWGWGHGGVAVRVRL